MHQACPKCHAVNSETAESCWICGERLPYAELAANIIDAVATPSDQNVAAHDLVPTTAPAPKSAAEAHDSLQAEPSDDHAIAVASSEPEWRLEVARRMEAYRAKHPATDADIANNSQAPLPFEVHLPAAKSGSAESAESSAAEELERLRATFRQAQKSRGRKAERVEISVLQPELDFSAQDSSRFHPNSALVPVAEPHVRQRAGLLDAVFLALAFAGFLSLFHYFGGHISLTKSDALVCAVAFFLFYATYFALFTIFGGCSPGIQLCGLSVVDADGGLPTVRQLAWRSFGYVLSGGTLFLGFLWALWDEDSLTWQDRISQTYVTTADPLVESSSLDAGGHTANPQPNS